MKTIFINRTIELTQGDDGFWRDALGTVYAFADEKGSVDKEVRYGIGLMSIPDGWLPDDPARVHDFAYSCPVYQAYHSRAEADALLETHLKLLGYPVIGWVFKQLSKVLGGRLWEHSRKQDLPSGEMH